MTPVLDAAAMRAAEAAAIAGGETVATLMARAGAAVAEAAWRFGGGQPVLVLCGPGNNGGDGYVAAALLAKAGVAVRIAGMAEPRTDAARAARARWHGPVEALGGAAPAPVLVDALFGVGLDRALDDDIAAPLARLARAARFRLAVDLPSGVGSDDGAVLGAMVPADLTLALGALKPAHLIAPAAALCGHVRIADIGVTIPPGPTMRVDRPRIARPGHDANKYTRGHVLVVGGAMAGAALLAATAAQRAGAGYVALAGPAAAGGAAPHALVRHPTGDAAALAALLDDRRIGAVVIGPGLGREAGAKAMLDAALACAHPLVIDADALTLLGPRGLARLTARAAPALLTPHEGEFARLFGGGGESKLVRVRAAAARAGAAVLLKGSDSVVALPDGTAGIATAAPAWLASAGTGDVLAGIAGARLAAGSAPFDAACEALWLHGEAARRAGPGLVADDLVTHLAAALGACG